MTHQISGLIKWRNKSAINSSGLCCAQIPLTSASEHKHTQRYYLHREPCKQWTRFWRRTEVEPKTEECRVIGAHLLALHALAPHPQPYHHPNNSFNPLHRRQSLFACTHENWVNLSSSLCVCRSPFSGIFFPQFKTISECEKMHNRVPLARATRFTFKVGVNNSRSVVITHRSCN